jgi:integrase
VNGKLERLEGDGWEDALKEYKAVADDLHAGRTPRVREGGLTLDDLCNRFLTSRLRKKEAGELTQGAFDDYKIATDMLISVFGRDRYVDDLAADDFGLLRERMVKKWGPVRLANTITRIKSVFKHALDNGLIERGVRYGSEFNKPDKSVMRRHKAKSVAKMFEAEEVRTLLDGAMVASKLAPGEMGPKCVRPSVALRAMILLGVNGGLGNLDCALLPLSAVNLETGWVDFPRPKTGIGRRFPLWPETVAAIRTWLSARPKPAALASRDLVFLTGAGLPWIQPESKTRVDGVTKRFGEHLRRLGIRRKGIGFYTLRHVFRTVADAARDTPAIDLIMGHNDPSMGAVYRERIDDARLKAVTDHVRAWLFTGHQTMEKGGVVSTT